MGNSKLKPKGWWSRRHETREAQDAARERYQNRVNENKAPKPPKEKG